jgi:hypothetical protein
MYPPGTPWRLKSLLFLYQIINMPLPTEKEFLLSLVAQTGSFVKGIISYPGSKGKPPSSMLRKGTDHKAEPQN